MIKQDQLFADNPFPDDPVARMIYKIPCYRTMMVKEGAISAEQKQIGSPKDVYNVVRDYLQYADREYFLVLMLNTKNCVNKVHVASIGTLNSSLVHPREVFKVAIIANAAAVVLVHNHPSGNVTPSHEDIKITHRLVEASKIIGIEILDHVIIGDNCWCSMKEQGIL